MAQEAKGVPEESKGGPRGNADPRGGVVGPAREEAPLRKGGTGQAGGGLGPIRDKAGPARDNIVLIGMPGAGKSTLGVVLAKMLNYDFLDADLVIQKTWGKTLQQIIDTAGPEGFIEVENKALCSLAPSKAVIATGGSAVYSDEAMRHLADLGAIVYLQVSYEEMIERLDGLEERGVVLKGGAGMGLYELYDERRPLYEQYADTTVDIDGLSITEAARKVAAAIAAMD